MRYLTVNEVLETYSRVMQQSGGAIGIHDLGALESAVAQPRMTFGGEELYPTMEMFLVLNGHEISATVDEQVKVVLQVASSEMGREAFIEWLRSHLKQKP